MRSFWTFIGNDKFDIGCTGQTVYLYGKNGIEIAKFKDLIYAYTAAISPRDDLFVVKTTEGRLGVYSFDPPALIKKFRFSKVDGAQDDNFCFSSDGTEFYNIERHADSCKTVLAIYDTKDFSLKRRILNCDASMVLSSIEYSSEKNEVYLLGFYRDENGVAYRYFVGKLKHGSVTDVVIIPESQYYFHELYIRLRMMGFTKKAYEWSFMGIELEELKDCDCSLSKLWTSCNM